MRLPFILIFDIDKAIVGDVGHCVKERSLIEMIHKICKEKGVTNKCLNKTIDIQDELKGGLLRPNIADFIDFCDKQYKNVEICIYTNSSYSWTNTYLVPNIETALGRKFIRPLFTREDSMNNNKLLSNIYADIVASLSKKYPEMKKEKYQKEVFNSRIVMIDDILGNIKDFPSKQIWCPEYNYYRYYDIHQKLLEKYNVPLEIFNHPEILQFFDEKELPLYNVNGIDKQKDYIYQNILGLLQARKAELTKKDDRFFLQLIEMMKEIKVMDDKAISKINYKFHGFSL